MEGIILLLIGLFSGAYGIMVGAGGGFIFVPALLLIMNMPPHLAAGTGLVIVMVNSLSGVAGFAKQKRIDYQLAIFLTIGAFPGSFLGAYLTKFVSTAQFYTIFACVLIGLGIFLQIKNRKGASSAPKSELEVKQYHSPGYWAGILMLGIFMGTVSTFFGIGGGWLMVPILMYLYKVVPHRATATSVFALCLYSSFGVGIHIFNGNVDWLAAFWGGLGAMIGAQIGVFVSNRMSGRLIVQLLSLLLIGLGIRMLF